MHGGAAGQPVRSPKAVAAAINRALAMPLEERRQRHAANFRVLVENDLSHWAERFLGQLEHPPAAAASISPMRVVTGR